MGFLECPACLGKLLTGPADLRTQASLETMKDMYGIKDMMFGKPHVH